MKIKSSILSIFLIMVVLISACSSPAATTVAPVATEVPATSAPAATAVPTATTAPEPSPVPPTAEPTNVPEITLTVWASDAYVDGLKSMVSAAKEEYGVNLIVEQVVFDDLLQQFQLAAPAGEGPDIVFHAHNTLGEMVKNGLVLPLDLSAIETQYAPAAVSAWQYDGEQYGLPVNTENVGFFINTDVVPNCPATWAEVQEISSKISANNTSDMTTNKYGFVRMEKDPYHYFPLMSAFGGYVFGMTDTGFNPEDVGLDSEGALDAARFWDGYIKAGLQPSGVDGETMMTMFESGQSAMTITGPWYTQRVIDSGIKFKICPIPGAKLSHGRPFMGSYGYVLSAFSKNPDVAKIFVTDFLGSEANMRAMYQASPSVPANLAVLASIDDPYLAAYGEAGIDAIPMPAIPEMSSVWAAWRDAIVLIAQQSDTPENAFRTAAQQIRTLIAESKK